MRYQARARLHAGLADIPLVRICLHGVFIALLFLFVSAITISVFPLYSTRVLGLLGMAWILWCVLCSHSLAFDSKVLPSFVLILVFVGYVAAVSIIGGAAELRMFGKAASYILQVIPGAMLLAWMAKRLRYGWQHLFLAFFVVYVVHGVVIVASALIPSLRVTLEAFIPNMGNIDATHAQYAFRFRGLFNSAGSGVSAVLSIGALLGFAALKGGAITTKLGKLAWFCGLVILLWAILLTGRLGLFVIAAVLVMSAIRILTAVPGLVSSLPRVLSIKPGALMMVLATSSVVVAMATYKSSADGWSAQLPAVNLEWILRDFVFLVQGQFNAGTLGILQGMLIFPNDTMVWLFGKLSSFETERVSTDIGYLRILWAVGLVGAAIFYSAGLYMFRALWELGSHKLQRGVLGVLAVVAGVIEAKEPFFSDLRFSTIYVTIFCFMALKSCSQEASSLQVSSFSTPSCASV